MQICERLVVVGLGAQLCGTRVNELIFKLENEKRSGHASLKSLHLFRNERSMFRYGRGAAVVKRFTGLFTPSLAPFASVDSTM